MSNLWLCFNKNKPDYDIILFFYEKAQDSNKPILIKILRMPKIS